MVSLSAVTLLAFLGSLAAWLLNGLRQEPAVNPKIDAGNKTAGFFAREEDRGAGQFGGISKAPHRRMAQNHLAAGRGGSILVE
jgi:hypothetical protein